MTITDEELRKLAEAATPGPWFRSGVRFRMNQTDWHSINHHTGKTDENIACVGFNSFTGLGLADADFIAAANPSTITELLNRIAALEAEIASKTCPYCDHDKPMRTP